MCEKNILNSVPNLSAVYFNKIILFSYTLYFLQYKTHHEGHLCKKRKKPYVKNGKRN